VDEVNSRQILANAEARLFPKSKRSVAGNCRILSRG
jgi:hypothetical protein